jgi:hypothetical protein
MTMPKKGTRKITIDNREFNYRIKSVAGCKTLTVEFGGFYGHKDFEHIESVTPAMVKEFILSVTTTQK